MRTVGSHGPNTQRAIREAGLRLIMRHGYEGMTLRELASDVGIQAGSLYNHFANKQQLLFDLVLNHMEEVLSALHAALEGADEPEDALARFCDFHIRYHMTRKAEVFVINFELRSLEQQNRKRIVALRSQYESALIDIIKRCQATGRYRRADPVVSTYGIISMLTGVCTWYREGGRLSADQIIELYTHFVFSGVCAPRGQAKLHPKPAASKSPRKARAVSQRGPLPIS